jgi:hypothetical protein
VLQSTRCTYEGQECVESRLVIACVITENKGAATSITEMLQQYVADADKFLYFRMLIT